jgi:hypothetical protein
MKAKYLTLAIPVMAVVVLVSPPAISSARLVHGPAISSAGPVQVPPQSGAAEPGADQTESRAALLVQFGDGSYVTRCVSFAGDSIAGLELLARSGLEANLWGGAVCRIQEEGCAFPAQPCFCQCMGSSCKYWSYWHWREDGWAYSQIGSGDYRVHDGDADAWLWGNAQAPPIALSFAEVCGPSRAATAALNDTAPRPEDGETTPAATHQSSRGASPNQYAVFLIMAIALVAGFWLRRRHGG